MAVGLTSPPGANRSCVGLTVCCLVDEIRSAARGIRVDLAVIGACLTRSETGGSLVGLTVVGRFVERIRWAGRAARLDSVVTGACLTRLGADRFPFSLTSRCLVDETRLVVSGARVDLAVTGACLTGSGTD